MESQTLEEQYLQKKQQGMQYSEIRAELKREGLYEDEIKEVINFIDNQLLNDLIDSRSSKRKEFDLMPLVGMILVAAGCFFMVASYMKWIDLGDRYMISTSPFLLGLGIIAKAKRDKPSIFDPKE